MNSWRFKLNMSLPDKKIIFTNGCFDVLHRGHVELLRHCRELFPNSWVVVGLNSDKSVRSLKGPTRPINNEEDRKFMLLGLKYVDEVNVFDEDTPLKLIRDIVQPDFIVKGGDYTPNQVAGHEFAPVLIFNTILNGDRKYSTTDIVGAKKSLDEIPN